MRANLESICNALHLPFMYWRNSYEDDEENFTLHEEIQRAQMAELAQQVQQVQNLRIASLEENAARIKARAEELRGEFPEELEEQLVTVQKDVVEEYTQSVTKQRPKIENQWAGTVGKWTGQKKQKVVWETYTEDEVRYRTRKENEDQKVSVPKQKPAIEYFLDLAKKEKLEQLLQAFKRETH